jgi:hypothetical protein
MISIFPLWTFHLCNNIPAASAYGVYISVDTIYEIKVHIPGFLSPIPLSEWLLFNANSAIFQLYHGENKLIFNELMMMSALY